MQRSRSIISLFLMLLLTITVSAQISFLQLTIDEAKERASAEGKDIFLDFRADWCKPCLAMEKTTFKDKQVGRVINTKYIPLKIDVDFFTGMDLQEEYNVSVLPTILIINSYGEVQNRLIGEKTATSLLAELGYEYNGSSKPKNADTSDEESEYEEPTPKKECKFITWWRGLWN